MSTLPEHVKAKAPLVMRDQLQQLADGIEQQAGHIPWQKIVSFIEQNLPLLINLLQKGVSWQAILELVIAILSGLTPTPAPPPA